MRRARVGIAAVLLGDPAVLIFDEPFNDMDPEGTVWMKGFPRSLAQGRAVLVSSHLMSELQDTAGHLVVVGNRITLRTTAPAEAITVLTSAGAEVTLNGSGVLKASNLSSERVVATLTCSSGSRRRRVNCDVVTSPSCRNTGEEHLGAARIGVICGVPACPEAVQAQVP